MQHNLYTQILIFRLFHVNFTGIVSLILSSFLFIVVVIVIVRSQSVWFAKMSGCPPLVIVKQFRTFSASRLMMSLMKFKVRCGTMQRIGVQDENGRYRHNNKKFNFLSKQNRRLEGVQCSRTSKGNQWKPFGNPKRTSCLHYRAQYKDQCRGRCIKQTSGKTYLNKLIIEHINRYALFTRSFIPKLFFIIHINTNVYFITSPSGLLNRYSTKSPTERECQRGDFPCQHKK